MRILLIANFETSFVMDDLAILSELGETRFWNTNVEAGLLQPGGAKLMELIASSDVVYGWFASVHLLGPAIMCRLIGVPLVVVSGGYDTARVPEIGYGNAGHAVKKLVSRSILKRASAIIVNSRFSVSDMLRFMPEAADKLYCLSHRINPQLPENEHDAPARNPKLLVSVALLNRMNYRRKKMEFIKEIARAMPDYEVVHIGRVAPGMEEEFHHNMPGNMRALGYVSDEELWQWYQRAHGLLIPSWHEGFGLTAAEAPAAGCIPFISGAGAQTEVTRGFGIVLPDDDVMRWKKAIEATQQFPQARRKAMQQAMIKAYTGSHRKEGLREILKSLCASHPDCRPSTVDVRP